MTRVLYAGGAGAMFGPLFALSPFALEVKGLQFHNWARPFIEGLEQGGAIQVKQLPSWEVYSSFPRAMDALRQYDVVIIEEVEADIFYFYPEFYTPEAWTSSETIVLPNRLELLRDFVHGGGGLLMVGGWLSFQGRFGHGVWRGTPVEEALPVTFQATDDRVETPQGARVQIVDRGHPVMTGVPWETFPPLLGYNRATPRPDARVLATIQSLPGHPEDPLIAVREYGQGRTLVFASDTTPHWGVNFMKWAYYQPFWRQAILWLGRHEPVSVARTTPAVPAEHRRGRRGAGGGPGKPFRPGRRASESIRKRR